MFLENIKGILIHLFICWIRTLHYRYKLQSRTYYKVL